MKKTKTIEVEICDLCGSEVSYLITCGQCKKEVCPECHNYTTVHVQYIAPWKENGLHGATAKTLRLQYNGSFCGECSNRVIKELERIGLLASEDEESYTVLD